MTPKQFIPGGTKILKDERGNLLIITAFIMLVIVMLFAGLCEFGRIMLLREQTQTAADSAALSIASGAGSRSVDIVIHATDGEHLVETPTDSYCVHCGDTRIVLPGVDEKTYIDDGKWLEWGELIRNPSCDCSEQDLWFEVRDREVNYGIISAGFNIDHGSVEDSEESVRSSVVESLCTVADYFIHDNEWVPDLRQNTKNVLRNTSDLADLANVLNNLNTFQSRMRHYLDVPYEHEWDYWDHVHSSWLKAWNSIHKFAEPVSKAVVSFDKLKSLENTNDVYLDSTITGPAADFFNVNKPNEAVNGGIVKTKVYGGNERNSPYYPSAVVYASTTIDSLFPQWFGEQFSTTVCGQGSTYFRDLSNQVEQNGGRNRFYSALSDFGKWTRAPEDACWVDW